MCSLPQPRRMSWSRRRASYRSRYRSLPRPGVSMVEMVVALGLLVTTLSIAVPLVVRQGRVLMSYREYQWALDELTNQCDRLAALPSAERTAAFEQISPSPFTAEHLPGARLDVVRAAHDQGERVTLSLTWDEPQRRAVPVRLTVWLRDGAQHKAVQVSQETQP